MNKRLFNWKFNLTTSLWAAYSKQTRVLKHKKGINLCSMNLQRFSDQKPEMSLYWKRKDIKSKKTNKKWIESKTPFSIIDLGNWKKETFLGKVNKSAGKTIASASSLNISFYFTDFGFKNLQPFLKQTRNDFRLFFKPFCTTSRQEQFYALHPSLNFSHILPRHVASHHECMLDFYISVKLRNLRIPVENFLEHLHVFESQFQKTAQRCRRNFSHF